MGQGEHVPMQVFYKQKNQCAHEFPKDPAEMQIQLVSVWAQPETLQF